MVFSRKRPSPEQILHNTIGEQRNRLTDLHSLLAGAEAKAASSHEEARALTLGGGSDEDLDAADRAIVGAERRCGTLRTEIAQTESKLADLESELASIVSAKVRQTAANQCEAEAVALEQCISDFSRAMTALRDAAAAASANAQFEIGRLRDYASTSLEEIPSTIAAAAELLRSQARQVLNGEIRPRLPTEPSRPAPIVQEPLRRIFTLTAISWLEGGVPKSSARHQFADLPIPVATKALTLGYIIQPTDERVRSLSSGFAAAPLPGPGCVNLDDENLRPFRQPIGIDIHKVNAGFAETRGPSRASWVERGR